MTGVRAVNGGMRLPGFRRPHRVTDTAYRWNRFTEMLGLRGNCPETKVENGIG